MHIHWFEHSASEGLGEIEGWLLGRGHTLSCTRFHAGDAPPSSSAGFDWLIVMGGAMNVYQHRDYPWLRFEKQLIHEAIADGKRVMGICLGAQLIADVLGAKVFQNTYREVGWFPVRATPTGIASPFAFPPETMVMHWHGDTFSLPPGGVLLAESDGCVHQAFSVGGRVLGLQFHLEMTAKDMSGMAQNASEDLKPDLYVQPVDEMIKRANEAEPAVAALLDHLLTVLEKTKGFAG